MLKGIDPILPPELLMHLCAMGHGEWVAVVDANFTAQMLSTGKALVRIPGLSLARVSAAVLSVFPLADDVGCPAAYMHNGDPDLAFRTAAQQQVVDQLQVLGLESHRVQAVERYAFYEKIRGASVIVQSGETTAYGNAMFCKGVIIH
jgi:L-fucose mutarotase